VELEIEQCLDDLPALPSALEIGKAMRVDDARGRYIEFLKASLPRGLRLEGMKVVIDSANGAAYDVAPRMLRELGCDVVSMFAEPDGYNINRDCGSTYPEAMCAKVIEVGADLGLALDGDADRLIACDARGECVDGDRVIAILAEHANRHGKLRGGAVVTTLMSNMGLERYLHEIGLKMYRAAVGDRYVLEMMREKGCNLGGEQSGHVIMLDSNTTGDGLMSALQLLCAMKEQAKPIQDMASSMVLFPQNLWNIVMPERKDVMADEVIQTLLHNAELALGKLGRVSVRMSGTEPKLRVMVEAENESLMLKVGSELTEAIKRHVL